MKKALLIFCFMPLLCFGMEVQKVRLEMKSDQELTGFCFLGESFYLDKCNRNACYNCCGDIGDIVFLLIGKPFSPRHENSGAFGFYCTASDGKLHYKKYLLHPPDPLQTLKQEIVYQNKLWEMRAQLDKGEKSVTVVLQEIKEK